MSTSSIREELVNYLKSLGQVNPELNADQLLTIEGGFQEKI